MDKEEMNTASDNEAVENGRIEDMSEDISECITEDTEAGVTELVDDSLAADANVKDNEAEESSEQGGTSPKVQANTLLPVTLLAALIGLLLGPILAVACVYITGRMFYPLFIAAPLLIYLFNLLLRGERGIRAIVVTVLFSLASAYLAALSQTAALYAILRNLAVLEIPSIIVLIFGRSDAILTTDTLLASASAYIYPLVFTALGVVIAAMLLKGRDEPVDVVSGE